MSVFTDSELEYLRGGGARRLGRLATVGEDGTPHVVPVGFSYEPAHDSIDVSGHRLERTKKYGDVQRTGRASIVVDDLASTDPWRPRGVEIRGRAEVVSAPRPLIRIHPERVVSWGVDARGRLARSVRTITIDIAAAAG